MTYRLGLSCVVAALTLGLATGSATALPATGAKTPALDAKSVGASVVTPAGWHGRRFGYYPRFRGYGYGDGYGYRYRSYDRYYSYRPYRYYGYGRDYCPPRYRYRDYYDY